MGQSDRQGGALAVVLIVMLTLALVGGGLLTLSSVDGIEAGRSVSQAQAFWAAEAGIEQVQSVAARIRKPFTAIPFAPSPSGYLWGSNVVSGTAGQATYTVSVTDDPAWTNASRALKKYIVRSTGVSAAGARQTITMRATIMNFASYMHASHSENNVNFATGDRIDGPVYTDDQLHIIGPAGPEFLQSVSSGRSSVDYNGWTPSAAQLNFMYKGGMPVLNAAALDISGQFSSDQIADIQNTAGAGGLQLTGDYGLTFTSAGGVVYSNRATRATSTASLAALNGAIYVSGDAYVKGVVYGSVTVAANDMIYIASNTTYASASGANNPWASNTFNNATVVDKLGLIARNGVWVQGTNTIEIHGSIMVTTNTTGFSAESWNVNIGGNKDIKVFGGITQYSRGKVGQPTTPFNGFHKNYKFDTRFGDDAPPNFPYSLYVFDRWNQTTGN